MILDPHIKFYFLLSRDTSQCWLFNVILNIRFQQAIGDQHSDAGLPTEDSLGTAQTQQLVIPIQEQHPPFQLRVCGAWSSGSSRHVEEEGAARPWYQLPYQREDDNQANGWSRRFAGIRQGGGRRQVRKLVRSAID